MSVDHDVCEAEGEFGCVLLVVIGGRSMLGDHKDKMTYLSLAVSFGCDWGQLASVV